MLSLALLPIDVLERIFHFLSAEDVGRCCAVSRSWRETFSQDLFWKKRCDENLSYLKTAKCQVWPYFPDHEQTGLPPVGEWRCQYMREQHLWGNWRAGRYNKCTVENCTMAPPLYGVKPFEFLHEDLIFLRRDWNSTDGLVLWDVAANEPFNVKTCPLPLHYGFVVILDGAIVSNPGVSYIVVVLDTDIETKKVSFSKAFFFDQPEELPTKIKKPGDIKRICNGKSTRFIRQSCHVPRKRPRDINLHIHGDLFLGSIIDRGANQAVFHIWNYKTGTKLKRLSCPMGVVKLYGLQFVSTSSRCRYIPVAVLAEAPLAVSHDRPYYTERTLIFDVTKLDFFPNTITTGYTPEMIHENRIWCRKGTTFSCFNLTQTLPGSDLEPVVTLKHHAKLNNILVVNGSILFKDNTNKLLVFNKSSLTLHLLVGLGNFFCSEQILCDKFLLLYSSHNCYVFELRRNKLIKLFKMKMYEGGFHIGVHATNKSCTTLATVNDCTMETLTFW